MVATLLGTMFRPISEWVTGDKISLNAPYFEQVNGPIFLVLLLLMGAAPLLAWRRSGPETLRRNFVDPDRRGLLSVAVCSSLGNRNPAGFVGVGVLIFVFAGILQEYVRGVQARRQATGEPLGVALVNLVRRNGRRYGGYIVHIGVLMIALGIIGNEFFQSEVGSQPEARREHQRRQLHADLSRAGGEPRAELHRVHRADGHPATAGRPARSCQRSTSTTKTRSSR